MFDKITLIYGAASLPPRYHRSYTIILTQKEGKITISNYTDELLAQNFEIKSENWNNLQQFKIEKLEKQEEKITKGATGTHRYTIILEQNNQIIYQTSWDSLSEINENTENLKQTLINFIQPSLEELLNSTIQ